MMQSAPDSGFLKQQIRYALGRGLPEQAAEDVVVEAWEAASNTFDPERGRFEALMQTIVKQRCAYWWRTEARERRLHAHAVWVPVDTPAMERADQRQQELMDSLTESEREVFATWALQKHLGKGRVSSETMGASLQLTKDDYENAKRRLRAKLKALLDRFGWSVRALIHGDDDV